MSLREKGTVFAETGASIEVESIGLGFISSSDRTVNFGTFLSAILGESPCVVEKETSTG